MSEQDDKLDLFDDEEEALFHGLFATLRIVLPDVHGVKLQNKVMTRIRELNDEGRLDPPSMDKVIGRTLVDLVNLVVNLFKSGPNDDRDN